MGNAQARRPVDERAWDEDYQGEDVEIVVPAVEFRFSDLAAVTDNFHETYMLRKGFFGHIYRAPLQNVEVTVRMLRQDGVMQDGDFIATVNRLRNLNHANLMQLQGYSVDGPNRLLVYEYRPWRSLEYYLKDDRIRALDRMRRIKIAAGVAYGLDYLHRHFVMYGEFKPASILLDEEFNPRLTDFGVVTGLNKDAKSNYSPPDRLLTRRSDSYGFGLIVLQLLTGRELDTNLREWKKKMGAFTSEIGLADDEESCGLFFSCFRFLQLLVDNPTREDTAGLTTSQDNGLLKFSYQQLSEATEHFNRENFIAEGGYEHLYKGKLTGTDSHDQASIS
ncbi:hypothetical protein Droror1_Dr00008031, partial [Drosera rotundifolia]